MAVIWKLKTLKMDSLTENDLRIHHYNMTLNLNLRRNWAFLIFYNPVATILKMAVFRKKDPYFSLVTSIFRFSKPKLKK